MILFLAGLQTIPAELYEAAPVDGASAWQRFRAVTLPGLRPTTFLVLVLLTIQSFKVFDLILVMTGGRPGPGHAACCRSGSTRPASSTASSATPRRSRWCCSLLVLVITLTQFWLNKRRERA